VPVLRITRRKVLWGGLAAVAGCGIGYSWGAEPRWLQVRTVHVPLRRRVGSRQRILHLSDLHWSSFVSLSFIEEAISRGLESKPTIICLTGDFVTAGDPQDLERYVPVLSRLPELAQTFAVLGNHDGGIWSQKHGGTADMSLVGGILERAGITLLRNTWCPASGGIAMAGTGDLWSGDFAAARSFSGLSANDVTATILLAHNPDTKDRVAGQPWDLMLSGHTHGGQVVLPFVGAPFVPVRDRRYVAGLNSWGDRQIYTTRGVGNIWGLRFNCRPEISILELG
jgi:predicted MPP superfamily phosphohydrolase